jgi:hypothetical protein
MSKYEHIDFQPPNSVAEAAEKGLEYRKKQTDKAGLTPAEASKEGIGSGVQRAVNLKNRDIISPKVIKQMVAFFSRHEKNKAIDSKFKSEPWRDKGHVSWLLWGGDPGKKWAEKVLKQMEKADSEKSRTATQDKYVQKWYTTYPKAATLLGFLETHARNAGIDAIEATDVLEQAAYEAGYEGSPLPSWMEKLGKLIKVNVKSQFRAGQEDGGKTSRDKRAMSIDEGDRYYPIVEKLYALINNRLHEDRAKLDSYPRSYNAIGRSLSQAGFFNGLKYLTKFILEHKSIPKAKVREVEKMSKVFLKMQRAPNDFKSWWENNRALIELALETKKWPNKSETETDTQEFFRVGPFQVSNALHLDEGDLEPIKQTLHSAIGFLGNSRIPQAKSVLYGSVNIVSSALGSKTLAWYYPSDDTVYLRPHDRFNSDKVHNLIHELGHRYWKRFLDKSKKQEWSKHHFGIARSGGGNSYTIQDFVDRFEEMYPEYSKLEVGDPFPITVEGMARDKPVIEKISEGPGGDLVFTLKNKTRRTVINLKSIVKFKMVNERRRNQLESFPTTYSATSEEEHFSESFALYAMGKLPPAHKEAFERIIIN